jgi:hypothetical protein
VTISTGQIRRFDRSHHSSVEMRDRDQDQHAAHGRGAVFFQVGLRALRAHRLADLHFGQLADDRRAVNRPSAVAVIVAHTARKVMKLKRRIGPI